MLIKLGNLLDLVLRKCLVFRDFKLRFYTNENAPPCSLVPFSLELPVLCSFVSRGGALSSKPHHVTALENSRKERFPYFGSQLIHVLPVAFNNIERCDERYLVNKSLHCLELVVDLSL
jgi:hypothetical protein